ncbi:hypothetical protein SAY87_004092 [Trapa incisa]|uniref:RRM domain-containing protein n=1 Tax=Trapa incisa TaxID=236973 RepID=A0AAN7JNX1_9MYRT|nr:hypothetical protein SAY87_004092 [Trapa incisa]
MESDLGKLFIGGISWDTDEERLKEYFGNYGEVVEAVIMRDRATGRARGFGFIVFADPAIAERVTREKHTIDGRSVEAKKAVPREDQHLLNRIPISIPGSPSPGRTRKIFVGGLASNVTESDFKMYFDQFGTITDVVVMYDHNTQRPRGFGFITFDSEDAVDKVLVKSFHDLNGKMVEVKRAVPKEPSPSPIRSPLIGYNYNLGGGGRVNNFLNSYASGYNMASIGGFRVRMDGGLSPVPTALGGASPFNGPGPGHGMGMNLDQVLGPSFTGSANLANNLGYGRNSSSFFNGNSGRMNNPIGYQGESRSASGLTSNLGRLWGNGGLGSNASSVNFGAFLGAGNGSFGGSFGNNAGSNWNPIQSSQGGGAASSYPSGAIGFGNGECNAFGLIEGNGRRSSGSFVDPNCSFSGASGNFEEGNSELYGDGSGFGHSNWIAPTSEGSISGSFGYGLGNIGSEIGSRNTESFVGNYAAAVREANRGIAA